MVPGFFYFGAAFDVVDNVNMARASASRGGHLKKTVCFWARRRRASLTPRAALETPSATQPNDSPPETFAA
jgi:hypothetical protein